MTIQSKSDAEQKRKALLKEDPKVQEEKDVEANCDEDATEGDGQGDTVNQDKQASDDQAHHEWVRCDGCNMSPIVGVRYKCLEWVFQHRFGISSTDNTVSSVALSARITTCARAVRRRVSTPLTIVC